MRVELQNNAMRPGSNSRQQEIIFTFSSRETLRNCGGWEWVPGVHILSQRDFLSLLFLKADTDPGDEPASQGPNGLRELGTAARMGARMPSIPFLGAGGRPNERFLSEGSRAGGLVSWCVGCPVQQACLHGAKQQHPGRQDNGC